MGHAWKWVAVLAGTLLAPASAQAATVTVQREGQPGRAFDLAVLRKDVDRDYVVRTAAGEQTARVRGTSLNTLLDEAKADLIGAGSIEVSGGGRKVILDPDQLSGAGAGSPVVYAENGQSVFLRPAYSGDDLNGDSRLAGRSLTVRILDDDALSVQGRVSDAAVRVGQRVTFSAIGRGGDGQELTYNWTFDDGSRRRAGKQLGHRFTEAGSYDVVVGVTTPEDEVGNSDVIRVRVGPAPKGPDRQGGGTDASAAAPSSGTAAGGDSGASGGSGKAAAGPATSPSRRPPARGRSSRPAPSEGRRVEGALLADATVVPPREAARKRAARTGNDRPGDDGGFQVPAAAWGALITLGLAGTGALIELRTALPWPGRRTTA